MDEDDLEFKKKQKEEAAKLKELKAMASGTRNLIKLSFLKCLL